MPDSIETQTGEQFAPERDRERPGAEEYSTLVQTATAVLANRTVGPATATACEACGGSLSNCERITVGVDRVGTSWSEPRLYCRSCGSARTGRIGEVNVEATARLGLTSHPDHRTPRLCLCNVSVVECYPASEGR